MKLSSMCLCSILIKFKESRIGTLLHTRIRKCQKTEDLWGLDSNGNNGPFFVQEPTTVNWLHWPSKMDHCGRTGYSPAGGALRAHSPLRSISSHRLGAGSPRQKVQYHTILLIWNNLDITKRINHNDSRWYSLAQCRSRNCWIHCTFLFKICNCIDCLLIRPKISCKIDVKNIFDYEVSYMRSITAVKVPDGKLLFLWLINIKTVKHSLHF